MRLPLCLLSILQLASALGELQRWEMIYRPRLLSSALSPVAEELTERLSIIDPYTPSPTIAPEYERTTSHRSEEIVKVQPLPPVDHPDTVSTTTKSPEEIVKVQPLPPVDHPKEETTTTQMTTQPTTTRTIPYETTQAPIVPTRYRMTPLPRPQTMPPPQKMRPFVEISPLPAVPPVPVSALLPPPRLNITPLSQERRRIQQEIDAKLLGGPMARLAGTQTASLPCCRDRFGEASCQGLRRTQPEVFERRCLTDHDFHTLDCCAECRWYIEKNNIHPDNARALFRAPLVCRDKHSITFCRKFKAVGLGKFSCGDAEFAVRVCRLSCGFCNDELYSASHEQPLCPRAALKLQRYRLQLQ